MQATLTPVAEAFHELPEAQPLSCGITAHLVVPSHIDPGPAWRYARQDRVTRARHTGWYADDDQFETLTGFVYAFTADPDDEDDDPPTTYYALVESDGTDCHYLDPDVYDDPVTAAHAADRMAELLAELERECRTLRDLAAQARYELAEANRVRRDALGILRHLRNCPADGDALAPAFVRLWRQGGAGRRHAFELTDEHRPSPRERPFDPERVATRAECHADAWREGWDCAATS